MPRMNLDDISRSISATDDGDYERTFSKIERRPGRNYDDTSGHDQRHRPSVQPGLQRRLAGQKEQARHW